MLEVSVVAFLEAHINQPPRFEDPDHLDRVYKVVKALYGLHQAPRAWYETFAKYLLGNGFNRGKIDHTLFIKRQERDILLVQVYVDDIIFGSTKKGFCTEFERLMEDKFQMSSMGKLTFFLGEYSQWVERFMNYLEEQTDGEAMINSIKNGDQPLPRVTQVSIAGTSSTEQPHLKDKSMWSDQEKRIQKIDRLARSLLIQQISNDIYSLIDSNKTAKDLWDALATYMLGSEYGEQDRKAAVLYEYKNFKATEGE
nr:putative ribonuclease H-like domain-containing protein [Tanacetum cinerariifolium]